MNDGQIKYKVVVDSTSAEKSIDKLKSKTKDLSSGLKNAGSKMSKWITLPVVAGFGLMANGASNFAETVNKVDVAFGDSADSVKKWGDTTIDTIGLAKGTALDMASLFGDMATGMGINQKEAATLSTELVTLAGDLASFKNISFDVAQTALAGVFTGETESLKKLGIVMTQTNLQQFAIEKGMLNISETSLEYREALFKVTKAKDTLTKSMEKYGKNSIEAKEATIKLERAQADLETAANGSLDSLTEQEKIQLRYAYVTERSANAIGDYRRTSESTSNQMRATTERFKELSATLGEKILPVVNQLLQAVSGLISWFTNLDSKSQSLILILMAIAAAIGPILSLIGTIMGLTTVLGAAFAPIMMIVVAIAAIIGVIAMVIIYFDELKMLIGMIGSYWGKVFGNMWLKIVEIFTKIKNFIGGVFKSIGNFFISMINGILTNLNKMIKLFLLPLNTLIKGLNLIPGVNIPTLKLAIPKIPALATGTNNVQRDGLAYLHQGEAVVPKKYNPAMGGSQAIVIEMGDVIMDGKSVGRMMTPYITKTIKVGGGNV